MSLRNIFAIAALASLSSLACAQATSPIYVALDLGSTKIDDLTVSKGSLGLTVGYNANQYFATEIAYRNLGKVTVSKSDYKVSQVSVSMLGTVPLEKNIAVYGRLGYNKLKIDTPSTLSAAESGVLYGVGARYAFTPSLCARVEFQKPAKDTRNLNVGLAYLF